MPASTIRRDPVVPVAAGEERDEVAREGDHQVLLGVVRDQGDVHRSIISTGGYGGRSIARPPSARALYETSHGQAAARGPE